MVRILIRRAAADITPILVRGPVTNGCSRIHSGNLPRIPKRRPPFADEGPGDRCRWETAHETGRSGCTSGSLEEAGESSGQLQPVWGDDKEVERARFAQHHKDPVTDSPSGGLSCCLSLTHQPGTRCRERGLHVNCGGGGGRYRDETPCRWENSSDL